VTRNEQAHAALMRLYHSIAPIERLTGKGSWNSVTGNVEMRLECADLLGFIFIQLGAAVIGHRRFGKCLACGKWSLLKPGVNRSDRATCSDYCRLKLYRQRRVDAVALDKRGWDPARIAKKIGADIRSVKKWISHAEG